MDNIIEHIIRERNGIDLNVYHVGIEKCAPQHHYGPAVRDHYLIHYILKGQGTFYVGDKIYKLSKDQGFLICPDIITYYEADFYDPWEYMWVGFNGFKATSYLKHANLTFENPVFVYNKDRALEECLSSMIAANNYKKSNEIRLKGLIHIFLSELIDNSNSNVSQIETRCDKNIYVKKAVEYISSNYYRDISIKEIADYLGLSRNYFCSIFKDALGKSPQEFLIQFRMDKACEYMHNNNLSISDISRSVGYDDPLTFSKMFKKTKGLCPERYRQYQKDFIQSDEVKLNKRNNPGA